MTSKYESQYPVVDEPGRFPYSVVGDLNKEPLVLLAGFPDNNFTAWGAENLEALAKDYYVITLCLPGYSSKPARRWGYDFTEMTNMFHSTITPLINDRPFILIGHDWGSLIAQLYQNRYPETVSRLVLIDVGKDMPITFIQVLYQTWFGVSYFIANTLGDWLGTATLVSFFLLCNILPISPTPNDRVARKRDEITVHLCYPYYHLLILTFTGEVGKLTDLPFPTCPTLYLYGSRKRTMFHGSKFLSNSALNYHAFDAGHWLQRQQPELFREKLLEFLRR